MKHILDSDFQYRPSFNTDVKKTFEKIRRQQQQAKERNQTKAGGGDGQVKVVKLEQLKKASST
jgi:hypothetical protein